MLRLCIAVGLLFIIDYAPAQKRAKIAKEGTLPDYLNPRLSPAERARHLLTLMTLEEKIGQMTQIATTEINQYGDAKNKDERFQPYLDTAKLAAQIKRYHIGSYLAAFAVAPEVWYQFSYELQRINLKYSRLGIPIIYGNDHVHGANYVAGATYFPQPLNIAATFNTQLAGEMGRITAIETADLGQHWNFAPILDVGRNPAWPRLYETFGESPYLCARMGKEYIVNLQNVAYSHPYKIAATAKHFIGYSDPKSNWDRGSAVISRQELREVFLPPFKSAIEAGVKTFMINSGEVNGVPVHASYDILTRLLRRELGFDGVILTDWADILQLIGQHKVAHNEKEATLMALNAGIDMSMTANSTGFCDVVKDLVLEGTYPIEKIDSSVYRILKLKFELGLFENPYPRSDRFVRIGDASHKAIALESARESVVLLKNEGNILPLSKKTERILIAGPSAHSKRNLSGGWTITWQGGAELKYPINMETVYSALKKELPHAKITYMESVGKPGTTTYEQFISATKEADHLIAIVGEEPYAEGTGNIDDLSLDSTQTALIDIMAGSGKPLTVVLVAGRPLVIKKVEKKIPSLLFAGLPCLMGGQAIAEILIGKVNPSGKLPVSYPKGPSRWVPHNAKAHDPYQPLFPFGHGLSYTQFEYYDLKLTDTVLHRNQRLKASVRVKNSGNIAGKEAVLWYITDEVRSITPTHKELRRFEKMTLAPGESRLIEFEIVPSVDCVFPDAEGNTLIEPGYFTIEVGGLKKRFLLKTGGAQSNMKPDTGKKYLQVELY